MPTPKEFRKAQMGDICGSDAVALAEVLRAMEKLRKELGIERIAVVDDSYVRANESQKFNTDDRRYVVLYRPR